MAYSTIETSSSGNTTIVPAVTGRKIRVLNYTLIASGAVSVIWKSGAATNISGTMALAANGGMAPSCSISSPAGMLGVFETNIGEGLVLNLSAAVQVGGHLVYIYSGSGS